MAIRVHLPPVGAQGGSSVTAVSLTSIPKSSLTLPSTTAAPHGRIQPRNPADKQRGGDAPKCAHENPPGSKFCNNCGHNLVAGVIPSPPTSPAEPMPLQRDVRDLIPADYAATLKSARASQAMVGERRIVTILFCDVTGSSAAAKQLDPEEWAEVMNQIFEHMILPVYQYECTVARMMGDAILAFFGVVVAHEDDPQRAVLAGLDITARIKRFKEQIRDRWGVAVDVRVGIDTGLVMVGQVGNNLQMEYTAQGDAINIAARMEQTAVQQRTLSSLRPQPGKVMLQFRRIRI